MTMYVYYFTTCSMHESKKLFAKPAQYSNQCATVYLLREKTEIKMQKMILWFKGVKYQ